MSSLNQSTVYDKVAFESSLSLSNNSSASSRSTAKSNLTFSLLWNITVSPCALLLNFVVITTFIRVRSLVPRTTRLLMIHQSVIEMTSATVGLVLEQTQRLDSIPFPTNAPGFFLCILYSATFWAIDTVLQLNNMLITIDRYFAVCFVFSRVFTATRVKLCILITWIIGLGFNYVNYYLILNVTPDGICKYQNDLSHSILLPFGVIYMVFFDFGPVICVIIFYPQMIYAIRKALKMSVDKDGGKLKAAASARLVKTCLIATLVLIVTNTPDLTFYAIMYCILGIPDIEGPWQVSVDMAFKSVYPLLSPIIYSLSTNKFRSAIPVAFGCSSPRLTNN